MTKKLDFSYADYPEPHRRRSRQILEKFPEVGALIGTQPTTIFYIIGVAAFQVAVAWLVRDQPWWIIVGAAYLLGAFADHALFALIHECAHGLLFASARANRWAGMLANMPQLFPSSVSFERYHLKHHSCQGVHELDADLPSRWEAGLFSSSFLGKLLWLLFFPAFQLFRLARLREIRSLDIWLAVNVAVQAVFTAGIWYAMGGAAVGYLFLSFMFSIGLHPVGARWIQEHYLILSAEQETYSYYGPLNKLAFNVGYHNEHHDFPSISWSRLSRLKKMAPEYYESLYSHKSWAGLLFRFLFDSEITLFNRILRKERDRVLLGD